MGQYGLATPQYEVYRVMLHPTAQTIFSDMLALKMMNNMSDDEMLAMESIVLVSMCVWFIISLC
jgi:hypothetical protein